MHNVLGAGTEPFSLLKLNPTKAVPAWHRRGSTQARLHYNRAGHVLGINPVPTNILFPVAAVAALLVLLKFVLSTKARSSTLLRYKRIDLFNSTEHAFLIELRRAAPAHIAVLAKVRVADIVSPQGNDVSAFNRIARKHVDFVLYNLQNRSVLRAIELDGPTHASKRAVKSDGVKNSCFASARIPLARVPVTEWNKAETLRSLFEPSSEVFLGLSAASSEANGALRADTKKLPGSEPRR